MHLAIAPQKQHTTPQQPSNPLDGASFSPRLDAIGIETSGFNTKIAGKECNVTVARFERDMPGAGEIQKFSITTSTSRGSDVIQYNVQIPRVAELNGKLEAFLLDLEKPETSKRALEALNVLARAGHLDRHDYRITTGGDVTRGARELESIARSAFWTPGAAGNPEQFEAFVTSKMGGSARLGWIEAKYIELKQYEGSVPPETAHGFAQVFRKFGADNLADRLERVNTIDPRARREFPA